MPPSPLFLAAAASALTFCIGQALLPTAHAQPVLPSAYRVLVKSLHTKHTAGGLEITGQIVNTGRQTLTYTSAVSVLTNAAGQELERGDGYLAAGPLLPGQTAEFRACLPDTSPFPHVPLGSHVHLLLREAGQEVTVETPGPALTKPQDPDRHRTTVW